MRNMAYVVTIKDIAPIEGKDRIAYATFNENDYGVICDKTYKVGEKVLYCEVDSILPQIPQFEFLRKRCFKEKLNGFLIKPMKMSGLYSFGIIFHCDELNIPAKAGDYTDKLKIRKYEPEEEASPKENKSFKVKFAKFLMRHALTRWAGKFFFPKAVKVEFPVMLISKSDESNIANHPDYFTKPKFHDAETYATIKMDGQSVTLLFKKDGRKERFFVFGRNTLAQPRAVEFMEHLGAEDKLRKMNEKYETSFALQGEFCDPAVQGGIYKNGSHYYVYRIRDLKLQKDIEFPRIFELCKEFGFEFVPVLNDFSFKNFNSSEELDAYANSLHFIPGKDPCEVGKGTVVSNSKKDHHEGIVVRAKDQSFSFKVKSKEYQLERS